MLNNIRLHPVRSQLLACLSIATLILLSAWDCILLLPNQYVTYKNILQILIGTIAITLFLFTLTRLGTYKNWIGYVSKTTFLAFSCCWIPDILNSFYYLKLSYSSTLSHLTQWGLPLVVIKLMLLGLFVAALCMAVYVLFNEKWKQYIMALLVIFSPLVLVFIFQFSFSLYRFHKPRRPDIPKFPDATRRVVWLIFDELDQKAMTDHLQELPNFKRLQESGFSAEAAHPPANITAVSVPSLWTGQALHGVSPAGRGLLVQPKAGSTWTSDWIKNRTVFEKIHAGGLGVSLVGWALPYCNLFPSEPGQRSSDSSAFISPGPEMSIFQWMYENNLVLKQIKFVYWNYFRRGRNPTEENHDPSQDDIPWIRPLLDSQETNLLASIQAPSNSLIFGHLCCPHLPLNGPPHPGRTRSSMSDYQTNLERCDQVLGRIMASLESHKTSPYMLIVSSDHWFRRAELYDQKKHQSASGNHRPIPFLVTLSDQLGQGPQPYPRDFNTVHSRLLIEAYLANKIKKYKDVETLVDTWANTPTRIVK